MGAPHTLSPCNIQVYHFRFNIHILTPKSQCKPAMKFITNLKANGFGKYNAHTQYMVGEMVENTFRCLFKIMSDTHFKGTKLNVKMIVIFRTNILSFFPVLWIRWLRNRTAQKKEQSFFLLNRKYILFLRNSIGDENEEEHLGVFFFVGGDAVTHAIK